MNAKGGIPKRRFRGFSGEWERRRLGDISDFITKGATPTTYGFDWVEKGIPFFRNDSIKDNAFIYGDYSYISDEANEVLKRSEITAKDILVAITGDIGKVGIVPNSIVKGNINQHMARVRIVDEAVPYFVYQYMSTEKLQQKYHREKTGLSMPQLSLEQIRNTEIELPSYEEQDKIAKYLFDLDNLITFHQRKYEKLQNLKKAYLSEMFPLPGEKYPRRRFAGFTDAWEQRKLDEVLIQRIEHQKITEDAPLLAFSYAEGVIYPENKKSNKRDFIMIDKFNKIFSRTEKDDIIYNPANVIHGAIHRNKLGTGVVSPIYKIFRVENACSKFLGERLHIDAFIGEISKYIEGSVIKLRTLSPEQFLEMSIDIPKSHDEQELIGSFFERIDTLIALQHRKYKKLQALKKAYLAELFPQAGDKG